MNNILIIGCGLLGSSLLRRISKKKIAKKIFVYEKSKKNMQKLKIKITSNTCKKTGERCASIKINYFLYTNE